MEKDVRPWGEYLVLEEAPSHKVKRIVVKPGGRLSLQYHQHRSEVWVVVQGQALVTLGETETLYIPGETVRIPRGMVHRVENTRNEDLVFIEVQLGTYFGEDDIIRLQDDYNRK